MMRIPLLRQLQLLVCLLLCCLGSEAQSGPKISGNFNNTPFLQFVEQVESTCACRFFFNDPALDTFRVAAAVQDATLPQLLDAVFKGTPFQYAVDQQNQVYVTRGFRIQTALPQQFFSRTPGAQKPAQARSADTTLPAVASRNDAALIDIGSKEADQQARAVIAGYVRQKKTGEGIPGAVVYLDSSATGIVTDQFGYFSVALTPGRHSLRVSGVGQQEAVRNLRVFSSGKINIELEEQISSLKGVTVFSSRNTNLRNVQMGIEKLNIRTIRQIPAVLGEVDVMRVVLALPGVTSVGEASAGFNVRGGAASQNLMLYNGATIYNPTHLFGFFAAFNPDMVKGVDLYKGHVPEKYGGRLASVLDVSTREGNQKKISGNGGIGLLTSRLSIEGPLVKDKTTFLLGGRTTYSNWLLKQLRNADYRNSEASFYDVDLHIQHKVNEQNSISLTAYTSKDNFRLKNDTAYGYGNRNINLKWKRNFSNRFTGLFTVGADHYGYDVTSEQNKLNAFQLRFAIDQKVFRSDFTYTPDNRHTLSFGLNTVAYKLTPGRMEAKGTESLIVPKTINEERALESALYVGDQFTVNPKLSLSAGIRFSAYQYLGAQTVYRYADGLPRNASTAIDSTRYDRGKIIQNWMGPEYRFSARYSISNQTSVKLGFNTLRQYIHVLSNTAAISPVDIWKLSDAHIRPQQGAQVSVGVYRNSRSNTIETSLEVYYKRIRHFLDYKSGAVLVLNEHVERDVFNARGNAYGAELLLKKTNGKLNGWIAYTFSRSFLQMDDPIAGEEVNNGRAYPADFDKPHNLNVISNYRFSHRVSTSFNLVYSTGRPITLPIGVFELGGSRRLLYGDRNAHRIPNYFRMDLSCNIDGNHRVTKRTHNSWSFGVYNLLARQNVYSVYFVQEGGSIKGYQLSIFGTAIPFITYNIRF